MSVEEMHAFDEERLASLLHALPPAPSGWIRAAQELPLARTGSDDGALMGAPPALHRLDSIVARAARDAEFRAALRANVERALADAGYEADAALLGALRERLSLR